MSLHWINSGSRLKLKADPTHDMAFIVEASKNCLRHHPTLARDIWQRAIENIRLALGNIEDIYREAREADEL